VIVTRPYVLESAAVPGHDVVLAQMKMGGLTVHASMLALTAGTAGGRRRLDASAIFAVGNRFVDFTGYYLCGPGNPAYAGQPAGSVRAVAWDIAREEFLPSQTGAWRPWPWPPGVDPSILLVHSDGTAMAIVVNDRERFFTPRAVGAWARLSHDLGMGARPLADPLVLMCCVGAQSSQAGGR
jgi:hypothetical protein